MKHKRNDPMCDPWDSQRDEKMQFLFLLLFALTFLSEMNWSKNFFLATARLEKSFMLVWLTKFYLSFDTSLIECYHD